MRDLPTWWFMNLAADRARRGLTSVLYDSLIVDGLGGPTIVSMERFQRAFQERVEADRTVDP